MSALLFVLAGMLWGAAPQPPDAPGALTLGEAIAEALEASPALQPPRDAVDAAGIQEQLQRSQYGLRLSPSLHFGARQNGLRQNQAGLTASRRFLTGTEVAVAADWMEFGTAAGAHRDGGLSFQVSQSLLQAFGPAPRDGVVTASRQSASAARALAHARQLLVIRTAERYFAIVRQQLLTEAAEQALARARRLREAADARARVGLGTELDVMRAELLAAQSEAAAASEREALERARDDLKVLLGRPLEAPLTVDVDSVPAAAPAGGAPPATDAAALARRLDVQDARARVEDAARAASLARWTALPDVQVTASYTRRGLGGGNPLLHEWLGGWRAGISTTYGLQRSAAAAAASAADVALRSAERDAEAREQEAAAEVRAARRAVTRTAGAIEIQRKAIEIAGRQARLAALRYERGLADNVDVIDAELNLLQARGALIGARVDHALARLSFDRARGALDPDEYLK